MNQINCPHCGAKMVEYTHSLNKPMISALRKLGEVDRSNLQELELTPNQYNNFQKLKYWELAYPTHVKGIWTISQLGRSFLDGEESISKRVTTYRGSVKSRGNEEVYAKDIEGIDYKKREEYVKTYRPAMPTSPQGNLFGTK